MRFIRDLGLFQENKDWLNSATVSDDGKLLFISVSPSCDPINKFFYANIEGVNLAAAEFDPTSLRVVRLVDNFDAEYSYIANVGSEVYCKTNLRAPKYKVVAIDIAQCACQSVYSIELCSVHCYCHRFRLLLIYAVIILIFVCFADS